MLQRVLQNPTMEKLDRRAGRQAARQPRDMQVVTLQRLQGFQTRQCGRLPFRIGIHA